MIECNVNNITKYYGADLIFENISFDIKSNERIGLVGPNGCGKTTILKIIKGDEHVQTGNVTFRKGVKLGYLDQVPIFKDSVRVDDIMHKAFEEVYKIKEKIDSCLVDMEYLSGDMLEKKMNEFAALTHEYEQMNGYQTETEINKVCTGLKISDGMRTLSFNLLSGGEKTRVMLAKILLEVPSVLMLDEPSNHLDLESIEWLEGYLRDYGGSVLIVSHDRYFLDNVCKKIIELSSSKAYVYHGNYSYYVVEKERRFLLEMKVYLAQERKIKRMEDQIQRYRIWGKMRDSDKMYKRAKELEKRLEKVEKLDKPTHNNSKMKIVNNNQRRSGKRVLEAMHISKCFGPLEILKDTSVEILYQDRLAILGSNGSGKSTLIKLLLKDWHLDEPLYKWGSKLAIGYLAQEVIFPDESISVLDHFMKEHEVSQSQARAELAKALFIKDDVFKLIAQLSGGEKSKLKLCSLTFNDVNFMVLDEPTNHLDIDSREILEELLLQFNGSILFVSHDRYFIKKIANRIGEIDNQNITYYEGDYEYYRFMKKKKETVVKKVKKAQTNKIKVRAKPSNIISEIELVEEKLLEIEIQMEQHAFDVIKLQTLYKEKDQLEHEYEDLLSKL